MKINSLSLKNFMAFDSLDIDFSNGINVIFGENSTGKTAILKLLYSISKIVSDPSNANVFGSKDSFEKSLASKLAGVFKCENNTVGRLVGRKQGSNRTDVCAKLDKKKVEFGFGNRQSNHVELKSGLSNIDSRLFTPIYIPPKEIISSTGNFTSLYEDYHIEFDETYYDLAKLLLKPLKKGANTNEQNKVLSSFSKIMNGQVIQRDNRFYLKIEGSGEFEMGLVSEGYRKLSSIVYLILSESIKKDSILFWDEPESNMNPRMISYIASALMELAAMGVQVFVATHSYFIQQEFSLASQYSKANPHNVGINFISLYDQSNEEENHVKRQICVESSNRLDEISHNSIMQEFDDIYKRELDYDND